MSEKVLVNKKLLILLRKLLKEREAFRTNEKLLIQLKEEMNKSPEFGTGWLTTKEIFKNYDINWKIFNQWKANGLPYSQVRPNCTIRVKKTEIDKFLIKAQKKR